MTVWDLASRSLRYQSILSGGSRVGVGFSPDGTMLATNGISGGVDVVDAATGAGLGSIGAFSSFATSDLAFSADGTRLAYAQTGGNIPRAQIWDVTKRRRVAAVEGRGQEGEAIAVALSADGRWLAVGGYSRLVRIWDARTTKLVQELDTAGSGALALEFSSDGRMLAVSGWPGASLWDVATGTRIGTSLTTGSGTKGSRPAMMDLSSDGRRLLITGADGQGAIWDIDPQSWARRACRIANRTLTRAEWKRFLPGRPYRPACAS